jgi:imidazolonepropionase-like amidohydrolase
VLAGTDSTPHGNVANEVRLLAGAGVPNTAAIAAASWTARSFLGLTSLREGAPADLVIYDADPTVDIAVIAHPLAIITKGRARRPRPGRAPISMSHR